MDKKKAIINIFLDNPTAEFHIREVARLTKLNHMTVRSYLNKFIKEELLIKKSAKLFDVYTSNQQSKKWKNIKLFNNLERLRESNVVEDLEKFYDYPTVVLFGSYAHSTDTTESDIDICVLSNITGNFSTDSYKKTLKKPVSIHLFSKKRFNTMKKSNPGLINSICNGIVLSGQLEVV
ncbi:MAG TPA: nucleotidyltransferase domain-containing protein [Candidatus Nanoarchaeia archaeon]|nr:nucleotidyltransferase domain-containing protein [Candidatus Nanoarchaeia archaeon]